jgi:hypothetical protein
MKKTGMAVVAAVFMLAACGGKNAAVKDFGDLFDGATKDLTAIGNDLKEAKDSKEVAAALNKVYDIMTAMKAKGEELEKKHGMRAKGEMPEELKAKSEAFQDAVKGVFSESLVNAVKKHGSKPEVMEALNKIKSLKGG